jgi:hypothetical protein
MTYLFTPPQRIETTRIAGALRYSYPVSYTVWKDPVLGWQAAETPATETLEAATQLLAVSGRPQLVDDATATELISAGIGTCVPA